MRRNNRSIIVLTVLACLSAAAAGTPAQGQQTQGRPIGKVTTRGDLIILELGLMRPSEVPDFFMLRNLARAGEDESGNPIYRAEKVMITIQDVIAANGPRMPAFDQAQKEFNTGIVAIVLPGATSSPELIERANGLRAAWIDYWTTITGGRATMLSSPTAPLVPGGR